MTERIHSARDDVSGRQRSVGQGMQMLRMCFTCNQRRLQTGGRVNPRTRQWSCAICCGKGAKP